jgi:hypothetical protein
VDREYIDDAVDAHFATIGEIVEGDCAMFLKNVQDEGHLSFACVRRPARSTLPK